MPLFTKLFSPTQTHSFFKKKPSTSTAFSWSDGVFRFIRILSDGERTWIDVYGERELPEQIISEGRIHDRISLLNELREVNKKYGIKNAHVLLPEEEAYVFHTSIGRIPGVARHLEEGVIQDHLRSYIQTHDIFPGIECSCEYDIVYETPDKYDLHVSVISERTVKEHTTILESAGIVPESLEVSTHHVSKHCNEYYGGSMVLIDFGRLRTVIALSHQGKIVKRKIIPIGYQSLSRVTESYLNIEQQDAHDIIRRHGLLQTHYDNRLLSELSVSLSPLTRAIDDMVSDHVAIPYKPYLLRFTPKGILVYGSGMWVKGLQFFLQSRTRLPVTAFSPIGKRISPEGCITLPADKAFSFGPVLSLALEHLQ